MAEELHFGRAAMRLYISQPSLSHQIRKLEEALETPLFVRSSRQVRLTAAGRTLAEEAPRALAALEHAVRLTRRVGSGVATTIRLGYTPVTGFDTLETLLSALSEEHPDITVSAQELYSAEIPGRLCAGDVDIGLALSPQPHDGVDGEILREDAVSAVLCRRHRLAGAPRIPVSDLRGETLLLFPRRLAPAYYDGIIATCHRAGFEPEVRAFEHPPVKAMLARLATRGEVGLAPMSHARYVARSHASLVVREVVDPAIPADLSVLWPVDDLSPAVASVLDTARRCARREGWLGAPVT
ncbi:DNA-binding transcriptional LysR family regulator [Actinoalloteichus hoggarensis]|uniref:HTH-type transcriptional regulator CynR n=1 Tax=Actinoalloteichus hoggarensis TaxID=1470176 RepID=A0A221VYN3_9PSEU|nr:HTH-type transcriptional regulator CynR [Actinoalloteichus hoggarensis]MBB5922008.1 DNA-binding transcriptional LysR family regulator [Actinoalloteichus hoggarensis]